MYRKNNYLKISTLICCGVVGMALLGGCGKTDVKESTDVNETLVVETTEPTASEEVSVEIETEPESEEEMFEEISEETEDVEENQTQVLSEVEIVNNNGYFVKMGDKVYFHGPDSESMGRSALWANYAFVECGKTVLYSYDLLEEELSTVANDYTCGPLSVQGENIYATGFEVLEDDLENVESVLMEFSPKKGVTNIAFPSRFGSLVGAGKNDSFVAINHYDYIDGNIKNYIDVYKDGTLQNTFELDGYINILKLGENDIFYIIEGEEYEVDYDTYSECGTEYLLMQMNATTGEKILLGTLPHLILTSGIGDVDECMLDDEQIYLSYASYAGSGHFYQGEGYFVQAVIGEENSISFIEMPAGKNEEITTPFGVQDGKMVAADGEPGTCEVNDDGILGYFDEHGVWQPVAEGWGKIYTSEDYAYKGVEIAEKIGDDIYLVYNDNERASEEDIGWRLAYYRKATEFYRVSIKTGEATLMGTVLP